MNAGKQCSSRENLKGVEQLAFELAWDLASLAALYRAMCAAASHETREDINLVRIAERECRAVQSAAAYLHGQIATLPVTGTMELGRMVGRLEDVRECTSALNKQEDAVQVFAESRSLAARCDAFKEEVDALEVEIRKLRSLLEEAGTIGLTAGLVERAATAAGAAVADAVSVASQGMLRVGAAAAARAARASRAPTA